ncbi:MAG: hypothetical protein KIT13_11320, partial [Burkholderiales bacterium]|nr:hypothetical protein [Burkholderiales bacterium]
QNIILMNGSSAHGGTGVSVSALGMLSMNESSLGSSYGNAYINTGGNVNLDDYSTIYGSPDVFMNVGGVININNDSAVEAGSPHTINLTFPLLTSGGFFVNGIEGVVFDGNTGFFANGVGAVLGDTLKVTYGGGGALAIPTEALIVAMGQSTKPPDSERDRDIFEDINDEKTKDAPVCR